MALSLELTFKDREDVRSGFIGVDVAAKLHADGPDQPGAPRLLRCEVRVDPRQVAWVPIDRRQEAHLDKPVRGRFRFGH